MKRIIWLSNNRFKRSFEVPFLRNLGYEVYEPKTQHFHVDCAEDSIFYESDEFLTIDKGILKELNAIDLWDLSMTTEEKDIINSNFDGVIFDFDMDILKSFIRWFKGIILCRTYGLENGQTYSELIADDNPVIFSEIDNICNRFRFIKPYEKMLESESEWFKSKLSYAPIPLQVGDKFEWKNIYKKVAIWAPEINSCQERKKVYEELSAELDKSEYVIYGNQSVQLMENKMALTETTISELVKYSGMIFTSDNNDYLPLEVLYITLLGMPVIYKKNSQLSRILCTDDYGYKNVRKIRSLVRKISKNKKGLDNRFIADCFSKEKCIAHWQNMTDQLIPALNVREEALEIAFVMPSSYLGGILDFTKRIVYAFKCIAAKNNERINVTIYHPEDEKYTSEKYFEDVEKYGITVRNFKWVKKNQTWLNTYYKLKGYPISKKISYNDIYIMEDGLEDLGKFDYIFMTSDYTIVPHFIPVRHSYVVHDVVQRFEPLVMSVSDEQKRQYCIRRGEKVVVTTEPTKEFVISYEGVEVKDTVLIPQMFDVVKQYEGNDYNENKYFIWSTNKTPHKNHVKAFKALIDYYENGGRFDCYMTGADVVLMNPNYDLDDCYKSLDYLVKLRRIIDSSEILKKHLIIKGNLSKKEYIRLLSKAEFSFHPGHSDNGNGAIVDAVQVGVPATSSDYPAMRYMDKRMTLNLHFFDWNNPESITEALFYMEKHASKMKIKLPDNEYFYKFTKEGQAEYIYKQLMSVIRG